ncbi:hypothetical protein JD844_032794 [Phrynosoma platyrhinos]|uniref:Uncharacterized protein n=1 Tax=Phrynosoma platyrhinos TaxID=52577 RepID=A0ABQ7T574_PHRPL|nr:hypothetical protein JD844_032794 [Phrynosoma platyrhinos]
MTLFFLVGLIPNLIYVVIPTIPLLLLILVAFGTCCFQMLHRREARRNCFNDSSPLSSECLAEHLDSNLNLEKIRYESNMFCKITYCYLSNFPVKEEQKPVRTSLRYGFLSTQGKTVAWRYK